MKRILFFLSLGLVTLFFSCEEESIAPTPVDLQSDFYPLTVGKTWIYSTDSIVYNFQLKTIDTLRGFMREEITESFETASGSTNYVIERSVNGIDYTNTIEVILVDTENSIEKRYAKEVYAKGVGLISREMIIIDSQDVGSGLPIIERPEKGFILNQSLIQSF